MARPKKQQSDLRDKPIQVRLTGAERVRLDQTAKAHGLNLSEFLRRRGLGVKLPPQTVDQRRHAETTTALLRLGVNLNQIAKSTNSGRATPIDQLIRLIDRINAAMDRLDEPN